MIPWWTDGRWPQSVYFLIPKCRSRHINSGNFSHSSEVCLTLLLLTIWTSTTTVRSLLFQIFLDFLIPILCACIYRLRISVDSIRISAVGIRNLRCEARSHASVLCVPTSERYTLGVRLSLSRKTISITEHWDKLLYASRQLHAICASNFNFILKRIFSCALTSCSSI